MIDCVNLNELIRKKNIPKQNKNRFKYSLVDVCVLNKNEIGYKYQTHFLDVEPTNDKYDGFSPPRDGDERGACVMMINKIFYIFIFLL